MAHRSHHISRPAGIHPGESFHSTDHSSLPSRNSQSKAGLPTRRIHRIKQHPSALPPALTGRSQTADSLPSDPHPPRLRSHRHRQPIPARHPRPQLGSAGSSPALPRLRPRPAVPCPNRGLQDLHHRQSPRLNLQPTPHRSVGTGRAPGQHLLNRPQPHLHHRLLHGSLRRLARPLTSPLPLRRRSPALRNPTRALHRSPASQHTHPHHPRQRRPREPLRPRPRHVRRPRAQPAHQSPLPRVRQSPPHLPTRHPHPNLSRRLVANLALRPASLASYSALKACIGSILEARHAGAAHAPAATISNVTVIDTNTIGSSGFVPYNSERIRNPTTAPPATPIASPITTGRNPSRNTSASTCSRCAPSAIRIPISVTRCVTRYDSTPYSPTPARSSDSTANASTSVALKLAFAVDSPTICEIVITSTTGSPGSSAAISFCIGTANVNGFPPVLTASVISCPPDPDSTGKFTVAFVCLPTSYNVSPTTPTISYGAVFPFQSINMCFCSGLSPGKYRRASSWLTTT